MCQAHQSVAPAWCYRLVLCTDTAHVRQRMYRTAKGPQQNERSRASSTLHNKLQDTISIVHLTPAVATYY